MSLELIYLEIQKRQNEILSVRAGISGLNSEFKEMNDLGFYDMARHAGEQIGRAEVKIRRLEEEIRVLMEKARVASDQGSKT